MSDKNDSRIELTFRNSRFPYQAGLETQDDNRFTCVHFVEITVYDTDSMVQETESFKIGHVVQHNLPNKVNNKSGRIPAAFECSKKLVELMWAVSNYLSGKNVEEDERSIPELLWNLE